MGTQSTYKMLVRMPSRGQSEVPAKVKIDNVQPNENDLPELRPAPDIANELMNILGPNTSHKPSPTDKQ